MLLEGYTCLKQQKNGLPTSAKVVRNPMCSHEGSWSQVDALRGTCLGRVLSLKQETGEKKENLILRWLGTAVTSHTASHRQAYTSVISIVQKAVQSTHCTLCNQPADTQMSKCCTL